jgi:hypothetical protein
VTEVLVKPPAEQVPLGKPAMVELPTEWWSPDWLSGLRFRTWIGDLCHHVGGGICVQPAQQQGCPEVPCIPFDPACARIVVLDGKLSDYP